LRFGIHFGVVQPQFRLETDETEDSARESPQLASSLINAVELEFEANQCLLVVERPVLDFRFEPLGIAGYPILVGVFVSRQVLTYPFGEVGPPMCC
jgi:hypothetical protein